MTEKSSSSEPSVKLLIAKLLGKAMDKPWFTIGVCAFLAFYAIDHGWHREIVELLQAIPGLGTLIGGLG